MNSRKLSRQDQDILGRKIIAGTFGLLILFGIIWWSVASDKPLLDELTMCPLSGETQLDSILIDKSDKWEADDITRVSNVIMDVFRTVSAQGRMKVYTITGEGRDSTSVNMVFDKCNPGSKTECNEFFANCKKIQHTFKQVFEMPFKNLMEQLVAPGKASSSPILETVSMMTQFPKAEVNKLHIVSDFAENGTRFRFYDIIPLDDDLIAEYPLTVKGDVKVFAYVIRRRSDSRAFQQAVERVWHGYFNKQGVEATFQPIFITD